MHRQTITYLKLNTFIKKSLSFSPMITAIKMTAINSPASPSGSKEKSNGLVVGEEGRVSDGGDELNGEDCVNFPNKRPSQLWVFFHRWIQESRLNIITLLVRHFPPLIDIAFCFEFLMFYF